LFNKRKGLGVDLNIKKILIADDEETAIDVLTLWVQSQPCFKETLLVTAMTAEETEKMIINERPELIFLDLGLGEGITGLDILKRVKPIVKDQCRIFINSCYTEHADECLKNGASGFIRKGTKFNEIKDMIQKEFSNF
jgi:DNA-binding NarL/FixJ family response regulator